MSETFSGQEVTQAIAGIESDLTVIAQLLRQLASDGYEATPEGLEEVGSMVFATSLRLSTLGAGLVKWIEGAIKLSGASRRFVNTVAESNSEIREAVALARESLALIKADAGSELAEPLAMVRDCLAIIETRAQVGAKPEVPASNVIPLFRAKPAKGQEGGAR